MPRGLLNPQSVSYLLIKGPDLAVLSVTKLFISGKTIVVVLHGAAL